jgi:hypothetical protein
VFEQTGEDLDFTAGLIVSNAFLAIWAKERPGEVTALVSNFSDLAPRTNRGPAIVQRPRHARDSVDTDFCLSG